MTEAGFCRPDFRPIVQQTQIKHWVFTGKTSTNFQQWIKCTILKNIIINYTETLNNTQNSSCRRRCSQQGTTVSMIACESTKTYDHYFPCHMHTHKYIYIYIYTQIMSKIVYPFTLKYRLTIEGHWLSWKKYFMLGSNRHCLLTRRFKYYTRNLHTLKPTLHFVSLTNQIN